MMNVEPSAAPRRIFDRERTPRSRLQATAQVDESSADPDFLAFLQSRLNVDGDAATALLGHWLADYRSTREYAIDVLAPRAGEQT